MSWLDEFKQGFDEDVTRGNDDITKAFYAQRDLQGKDDDAVRWTKMMSTHPVVYRARELMGTPDEKTGALKYSSNVPQALRATPEAVSALSNVSKEIAKNGINWQKIGASMLSKMK